MLQLTSRKEQSCSNDMLQIKGELMAKVERWQCDRCGQSSNGLGMDGWVAVGTLRDVQALIVRPLATPLPPTDTPVFEQHFCGMACAVSAVQESLRYLLSTKNN